MSEEEPKIEESKLNALADEIIEEKNIPILTETKKGSVDPESHSHVHSQHSHSKDPTADRLLADHTPHSEVWDQLLQDMKIDPKTIPQFVTPAIEKEMET